VYERFQRFVFHFALAVCCLVVVATTARAQTYTVDIFGPGQGKMFITLAQPLAMGGGMAGQMQELLRTNLGFLPFLGIIPDNAILGGTALAGPTREQIDFKRFQMAGSDFLLTSAWSGDSVELRVYEVFSDRLLLGKAYSGVTPDQLPKVADKFCGALMKELTGHGEFFRSTLAFVRPHGGKENLSSLWTVRPTGRNPKSIYSQKGYCLSPSWSWDAKSICFTHIDMRYQSLAVWRGGSVKLHKFAGNMVIGPEFSPSGAIAVSLIKDGPDPSIYMLNSSYQAGRPLVSSNGANLSPSFDASGSKMAFVSDRTGQPAVYINGGRVTYGGYDTDPSLSPDGTLLAFTRRTGDGFRIFLMDLVTGVERQLSFGPGYDENAAFAPDSYFIAFSSTRSGSQQLYLTTRHGEEPIPIPTGGPAGFPAWGLTDPE